MNHREPTGGLFRGFGSRSWETRPVHAVTSPVSWQGLAVLPPPFLRLPFLPSSPGRCAHVSMKGSFWRRLHGPGWCPPLLTCRRMVPVCCEQDTSVWPELRPIAGSWCGMGGPGPWAGPGVHAERSGMSGRCDTIQNRCSDPPTWSHIEEADALAPKEKVPGSRGHSSRWSFAPGTRVMSCSWEGLVLCSWESALEVSVSCACLSKGGRARCLP